MEQSVALNALAPFLALAKSATSPRAAADLITQATSSPNTYIFAELLQQKNIQALEGNEQYEPHLELLKCFAWGTWEQYKTQPTLPALTDAQSLKLRLLTLLTIASSPRPNLTYTSLCTRLDLASSIDLEHLVTQAIYSNLLTATLNPATQTVVITSVAPLRDLAPGSAAVMIKELEAWSQRCEGVLGELEAETAKVKAQARAKVEGERRVEKQVKAVTDATGKGQGSRGAGKGMQVVEDWEEEEADGMDVDGGMGFSGGGSKRRGGGSGGGGFGGLMGRLGGKG